LVYGGIAISLSLFLVFYCGPKWGKKNMLVYISVCSLIGSLSVVFTQGLGAAIVHSITYKNENQFTNWFIYLVLGIVIVTLVIEIVYLNKALNLFNTALVTPTYYVIFTTLTIISSIVLYRGFDASPVDIATCVLGFLSICSGVALLHNSKSQPDLESVLRKVDDDEKILLDEQQHPIVRRKSVFQMFESKNEFNLGNNNNEDDESGHHGSQNPGAADLFPAPFSGISRYASTTKRSQSIIAKSRLNQSSNDTPTTTSTTTKTRPHSNTISIGNTVVGEDGYNRELRWRDHATRDISSSNPVQLANTAGQYHSATRVPMQNDDEFEDEDLNQKPSSPITANNAYSVFTRKHSSSMSSSTHKAQNELDPLSSFRMQIHGGESEDREGLVHQQQHDWDDK
jgi:hypothetical protein